MCFVRLSVCFSVYTLGHAQFHGCLSPASSMAGDSTWAATYKSPLPAPMTVLGMPILQHPQPQLAQVSSGTISPFPTLPTSLCPATAHRAPNPSTCISLSATSRGSLGLWPTRPDPWVHTRAYTSSRGTHRQHLNPPSLESSYWSNITEQRSPLWPRRHRRHWERINRQLRSDPQPPPSYLRPLSQDMSTSPTRQAVRAPSTSFPDPPCHSPTRLPTPTEYLSHVSCPPSRQSRALTPLLPRWHYLMPSNFTKGQLRISALLSQLN